MNPLGSLVNGRRDRRNRSDGIRVIQSDGAKSGRDTNSQMAKSRGNTNT